MKTSQYDDDDKYALRMATAAMLSKERPYPFTLMEACNAAGMPYPYSSDDLTAVARRFRSWGIVTNIDDVLHAAAAK